jgi:hypothetical protein
MSKKLLRQMTLVRCIPHRPYKLSATQLQIKLEEEGIHVSLRTVQRDLDEMCDMGLFGLTSDERSKPHGWRFEHQGLNNFTNIMPLSLAVALKTWSAQASHLLPMSVLTELNPLLDKASHVIRESQSELAERWLESIYQSSPSFVCNPEVRRSTLIRDALWSGRKFSAEIQRVIKKRIVWVRFDQINPLGIINQSGGYVLFCTLFELDSKVYCVPFDHIKSVELTSVSATQHKNFNIQTLIREQNFQDVIGSDRSTGRIDTS